jgi:hypothetical protein
MSTKIMAEVWEYSQAKGSELLLLLALADYADSVHGQCWPAVQRLSMLIRMSERNTQYLLRKLEADGHIAIHLRGSPRKTNLYQVLRPWCKDCAVPITEGATGCTGNGAIAFAPDPKADPKPEEKDSVRAREEEGKRKVTKEFLQHLGLEHGGEAWEASLQRNGHHQDDRAKTNGLPGRHMHANGTHPC